MTTEGVFYSGLVTISGYFRFDAERSFRQYAVAHATAGTTPRTSCRWLTKEQMKSTADLDVHATGAGGTALKTVQVNWTYVPGSGATAQTGTATTRAASGTGSNPGTTTGSGTSTTGSGGGVGSTVSDGVNSSKQQVGTAVASSMTDATTTALGAMTGLMHRSKKTASTDGAAAPAGTTTPAQGATADEQAIFGAAPNTAASSTGAPVAGPPGSAGSSVAGPGGRKATPFLFCRLKATGSEFYSDVFPAGADGTDDEATRAFWKQVAHQYKTGSIPYRDNAVCTRAGSEQEALAARQSLMSSAPQRGLAKEKVVDTAWTYMGEDEK